MSETKRIDGKAFAEKLRADIAKRVAKLKAEKNITPGLAVVLVGNDPASEVYVKNKAKQTSEAGMKSFEFKLPEATTEAELLAKVQSLNLNPEVHGILVQLPLPKHIDTKKIIDSINPKKDVDGFTTINVGKRSRGLKDAIIPCTPLGCLKLIQSVLGGNLSGKRALIIGRSETVGKPMQDLLLRENCTVMVTHSKTANIEGEVKWADIVVAAVGKPELVKGSWLTPGAVVIDVGINRIPTSDGKTKLVGDVDFASCQGFAAAISPVPGGVGPMTIACLLENTFIATCRQNNLDPTTF